jgi:ubiquitin-protein ligase
MDRAIKRVTRDIAEYNKEPIEGTAIYVDESDIMNVTVAIAGPSDSVYEHGVYFYQFTFGSTYPYEPPKGKFLNWQNTNTRMHPNMYIDGKLCLSILGTWAGPSWTSIMTLKSIILNIQALLDDNPLKNEPGLEKDIATAKHEKYAKIIRYYNARDFINGTIKALIGKAYSEQAKNITVNFKDFLVKHFKDNKTKILENLDKCIITIPNQNLSVEYNGVSASIDFSSVKTQFMEVIDKV